MSEIHLVFGPQGAGKSTYARELAASVNGIRFSIDEWMQQLYGPDLSKPLDFRWIMERVKRCELQIWRMARQVGESGRHVVLDLGFMKLRNRAEFEALATQAGLACRLHYLTAPRELRRSRVLARNVEKGETFAFEVTSVMFDVMDKEFESPTEAELSRALVYDTGVAA